MPFIESTRNSIDYLLWKLAQFTAVLRPVRIIASGAAMLAVIVTGELLAGTINGILPADRSIALALHLIAGLLVAMAAVYEFAHRAGRLALRVAALGRRNQHSAGDDATAPEAIQPTAALIQWIYGVLLAIVLISGLQVWWFERFGWELIPAVSILRWRIAHHVATYYFLASLILLSARAAAYKLRKLKEYLLSP